MAYGDGPYGGNPYGGIGVDDGSGPSPITVLERIGGLLGCGTWSVYTRGRGGSPTRLEVAYTSISVQKVLNTSGAGRISVPNVAAAGSVCCEVFERSEPWRDEVLVYRDTDVAYVGPLVGLRSTVQGGELTSSDLFAWMEHRFIEDDLFRDGDAADVFRTIFEYAYTKDDSPNIDISTRDCGVDVVRSFKGKEFHRAADVLRELARTGLDFTMDGRRLLAGGLEVLLDTTPLILHDEGVITAEVSREGANFATDVAVFGATLDAGDDPVTGRAVRSSDHYGLIQKSFTELLIKDGTSANANALARLEMMQPAPLRVTATLSEGAAFNFSDLICGRRIDVRLQRTTCIPVIQQMRLVSVNIDVNVSEEGTSEQIVIGLVPLGVSEEN